MDGLARTLSKAFIATALMAVGQFAFAIGEVPRTITLDGRLFSNASLSTPLLDSNATLLVEVLNPAKNCVIYQETKTVDTSTSDGFFSVSVGAPSMVTGFSNASAIAPGTAGCTPGYTPSAGDKRFVRITVTPTAGTPEVLTPDLAVESVPSAFVAETVQGLNRSRILELGTNVELTQANVENVFSVINYPKLVGLLSGSTTDYVRRGSNGSALAPAIAGNASTPAAGQFWYDTSTNVLKYYDGTTVQTLGGAVASITSGTIGGSTSINTSGGITTSGVLRGNQISARSVTIYDSDDTNYITIQTPATGLLTSNYSLTLPVDDGTNGQVLTTNGSGVLSWSSPSAGGVTSVTAGTGLETSPGAGITSTGSIGIAAGGVGTTQLADGSVTQAKLETVSGLTAAAYGSSSAVPVVTVDNKGRITAITTAAISGGLPAGSDGQFLRNTTGTWGAARIGITDIRSTLGMNPAVFPAACTTSQTLRYDVMTDTFVCADINLAGAGVANGILPVANGGTGTNNGSITGTSALTFAAGGTNQNVVLTPSGTGNTILGGNVGLGSATPTVKLDVVGEIKSSSKISIGSSGYADFNILSNGTIYQNGGDPFTRIQSGGNGSPRLILQSNGAGATASPANHENGRIDFGGYDGSAWHEQAASVKGVVESTWTGSNRSMALTFATTTGTTTAERIRVTGSGRVGVGTNAPDTRLHVNGTIKIADGSETCTVAGNGGMIRYSGGNLQFCNGSAWQTLGVSGAGLASLNGQTGSSQTFAAVGTSGTAPAFSSGSDTHTLNIPMASAAGVTAGLISKTDYDAFNAKLGTSSTFSGDVSGTSSTTSVDRIKGTAVTITSLTTNDYLRYNGTAWVNSQLAVTGANFGSQTQNFVLAAPTGAAGNPTFRALASSDLPSIDAATKITGTLPVANGGTGTTTGSITGTGALTFAAGGTNQNVVLTPSGTGTTVLGSKVGIGTTSATAPLSIVVPEATSSRETFQTFRVASDTNSFGGFVNGTGADNVFTPTFFAYRGGSMDRQVTAIRGLTNAAGDTALVENALVDISGLVTDNASDPMNGNLVNPTNRNIFSVSNWDGPLMVVGPTGRMGIGTNAPGTKLDVRGTNGTTLRIVDGNQGAGKVLTSDANGVASWANASGAAGTTSSSVATAGGQVSFIRQNATDAASASRSALTLRNDGTGTTNEFNLMGLNAAGTVTSYIRQDGAASFANSLLTPIIYGSSVASGTLTLHGTSNATKGYVLINSTGGNVGIGTTSPAGALDVVASSSSFIRSPSGTLSYPLTIVNNNGSAANDRGAAVNFRLNANELGAVGAAQQSTNNGYLVFSTATSSSLTEKMRIDSSGNVGIGTSNPTALLHVETSAAPASTAGKDIALTAQSASSGNSAGGNIYLAPGLRTGTGAMGAVVVGEDAPASANAMFSVWDNGNWNGHQVGGWFGASHNSGAALVGMVTNGINNMINDVLVLQKSNNGGASAVGAGSAILFQAPNSSNTMQSSGRIESVVTTAGANNSADMVFRTQDAGSLQEAMRITKRGNLGLGANPDTSNYRIYSYQHRTDTAGGWTAGNMYETVFAPSAPTSATQMVNSYFATNVYGANDMSEAYGSIADATLATSAHIGRLIGSVGTTFTNNGSVDVANGLIALGHFNAGTTGEWRGLEISAYAAGGTVGGSYGVYINDMPGTTNQYGIYQNGADDSNYFAGRVGIGTATVNSAYKLDVRGDVNISNSRFLRINGTQICSSTGCTASSDRRLKKNILPLEESLDKILQLQGVSYDWKDKAKYSDKHQVGFIAQDLEKVFPEVVVTDKHTGLKSVAYDSLVAPVVEAIKSLYAKVSKNESRVTELSSEVEALKRENAAKTKEIEAMKTYLCAKDPAAPICH